MDTGYAILYLEINLFSLALIGIILRKTMGLSKMVAQRNFVMSIISEMIFFISDTVFVLISNKVIPGNGAAIMACKTVYFFSTSTMCFFWFLYFEYLRETAFVKDKIQIQRSASLVLLMAILLFANFFGGFLFYVDSSGEYHRGTLFLLTYALAYPYIIVACLRIIVSIVRKDSSKDRNYLMLLAFFPIVPGISGIIQLINPRIPAACVAMSLTTLVLYLSWIDQLIALDPLTGLSNRKQLGHSFEHWKKSRNEQDKLFLFLVDANRFKFINDTYGHLQGDNALKMIAGALRKSCKGLQKRAIIARYGGDEFVVLVATNSDDTNEALKKRINDKLAEIVQDEDLPFDLTISIGVSEFSDEDTLKTLIAKADKAMYEDKALSR